MTNLFINTVNSNYASFAIFQSGGVVLYLCGFIDKQENLNEKLALFLKSKKIKPEEISGVMVIAGPGSFSASRAGVVLANAFNFIYNIPVLGVQDAGTSISAIVKENFSRLEHAKRTAGAKVYYKNPPNITMKKEV